MADIKIYHNPRCGKSREGLQFLKDKGQDFEVIEYLKEALSQKELAVLISKLGIPPFELVRTNEKEYKELYKGKELSDQAWIKAMIEHPKLMQRPIVVKGNKAVVGRPAEKIGEIL